MKKRLIAMALLTVVSCVGVFGTGTTISSSADTRDLVNTPEPVEEVPPEVAAPVSEVAEVAETPPILGGIPTLIRSNVEMAPSFYVDCFSTIPRQRHSCRARFSRSNPEIENLRLGRTPGLTEVTRLVLARIIVSEANWIHDDHRDAIDDHNHAELDAGLLYQVLRYTRRSGETLLGAMRRHSPHVSEARPIPSRRNHARMTWVRELQLNRHRPYHFPEDLNWTRDYQPRWEAVLALAQSLLEGDADALGPYVGAPIITWGGRCEDRHGACDDRIAVGRGLVPFETGATANRFWCRPGATGCTGAPLVLGEVPATSEEVAAPETVVPVPVDDGPPEEEITSVDLGNAVDTSG